jgi:hypothetical protein
MTVAAVRFDWAPGRGRAVPADEVGKTVMRIERTYGECHPARLVEEARPVESPLHPLFEWDDDAAAEQWRTHQARRVINSLRVVRKDRPEAVPAFVHITRVGEDDMEGTQFHGYVGMERALADPVVYERVRRDAFNLAESVLERYKAIKELSPVREALEGVKARAEKRQAAA